MDPTTLTLREKIAQLIFPRIGSNLPPIVQVADDCDRVEAILADVPIGGLCLFNGNAATTPGALERLQHVSKFPLLIAADMERGAGQQVKGLSVFPHAMVFGNADERPGDQTKADSSTGSLARITAEEALAAGIQIVLGPVADVNSDPRNPIIATRAFSSDTQLTSELTAAYVQGCQSIGAIAAAKHFPGHGNTSEDSHETLPTVKGDREELMQRDLVPFQSAVNAGVRCVMSAHVAYPGLDPTGAPATISRPILTDLLRGEMGFDGVVITDSLLMAGVKSLFDDEVAMAAACLSAGADVLLDVADAKVVVDGLVSLVDSGGLSEDLIETSFRRVWKLKADVVAARGPSVFAGPFDSKEESRAAADALANQVARSALRECGDATQIPLSGDESIGFVLITPFDSMAGVTDSGEPAIVTALRQLCRDIRTWEHRPHVGDPAKIFTESEACDHIVVGLIVRPAAWHRFGLLPEQIELVNRLAERSNVSLVSLGVPSVLDDFPQVPRRVCAYSDVAVSQRCVAQYLFEVPAKHR